MVNTKPLSRTDLGIIYQLFILN